MKIQRITISNMFGIRAFNAEIAGDAVELCGANRIGKTSVLRAIEAAVMGGDPEVVVHEDSPTNTGIVEFETETLRVMRLFERGKHPSKVEVTMIETDRQVKAPSTLLKGMAVGSMPARFFTSSARVQRDELLRMARTKISRTELLEMFTGSDMILRDTVSVYLDAAKADFDELAIDVCAKVVKGVSAAHKAAGDQQTTAWSRYEAYRDAMAMMPDADVEVKAAFERLKTSAKKASEELAAETDRLSRIKTVLTDTIPNTLAEKAVEPPFTVFEGEVFYAERPLALLCGKERIAAFLTLAQRATGDLRVVLIDGMEALDGPTRLALAGAADRMGVQIIGTHVTEGALSVYRIASGSQLKIVTRFDEVALGGAA